MVSLAQRLGLTSGVTSGLATPAALFALTALAIGLTWWWLGTPVTLPAAADAPGQRLYCVSYSPFRDNAGPLQASAHIDPAEVDADFELLSKYTDCVRTYSVEFGLDQIPAIAQRHGLQVLQGLWLSNDPLKNRQQIATTIALGKQFPDVIRAIVVGNEVLLRGDMTMTDLMAAIREVKAAVPEPVTYADVWEYWLRYREVADAVDFVTIHILPYWEDFPLPASQAAAHVDDIRTRVAAAIPNKEIIIGEAGWPSAGRMREAARPSPSNQARVIDETVALAQREGFRLNVIEAFDQPWKRWFEGTVGGHWGIFDRAKGGPKFSLTGGAVSDHPHWLVLALAGILMTALMFSGAFAASDKQAAPALLWWRIAALAFLPAVLFGWTLERVPLESFTPGGWFRSLAFAMVAAATPVLCAAACATGQRLPAFATLLGGRKERLGPLHWALGTTFIVLVLLSIEAALGLVFDPRYRDIPFAPLCAAVLPFLVLLLSNGRMTGSAAIAERLAAIILALAAVYIVLNETFANWQAVWFCASLIGLAFILARVRDAPG